MFPQHSKSFSNVSLKRGCLAAQMCCGAGRSWEGAPGRKHYFFTSSQAEENCSFSLFQQNTFKMTSWRKWKQTFHGETLNREMHFDTSVGKWVSRIFWISSKLAVKANTIVLDGLLLFRMSLGTQPVILRGFYLTLQMEAPLEMEAWQLSRASQASGNCLWGLLVFSDIKGIRRRKTRSPKEIQLQQHIRRLCSEMRAWIWTCRSGSPRREGSLCGEEAHIPIHSIPFPHRELSSGAAKGHQVIQRNQRWHNRRAWNTSSPIITLERVEEWMPPLPVHVHLDRQNVTLL